MNQAINREIETDSETEPETETEREVFYLCELGSAGAVATG